MTAVLNQFFVGRRTSHKKSISYYHIDNRALAPQLHCRPLRFFFTRSHFSNNDNATALLLQLKNVIAWWEFLSRSHFSLFTLLALQGNTIFPVARECDPSVHWQVVQEDYLITKAHITSVTAAVVGKAGQFLAADMLKTLFLFCSWTHVRTCNNKERVIKIDAQF